MSDKDDKIEALIKRYGGNLAQAKPVSTGRADALIERLMGKPAKGMDLYVIFDATGSMAPYIDVVRRNIDTVTSELLGKGDVRISVNGMLDHSNENWMQDHALSNDADAIKDSIYSIVHTSNTDTPEAYECAALFFSKRLVIESKDRNKVVVLIGDSVPHGMMHDYNIGMYDDGCPFGVDYKQAFTHLHEQCDSFYFVGCGDEFTQYQQKLVDQNKGQFVHLDNMVEVLPELLVAMTRKSQSESAYNDYMHKLEAKNPDAAQKIYALLPGRK